MAHLVEHWDMTISTSRTASAGPTGIPCSGARSVTLPRIGGLPSRFPWPPPGPQPHFGLIGKHGILSLSLDGASRVSVIVTDLAGKQVYSRTWAGEKAVAIPGLKRGVYLVRLVSGRESETRRITLY